MELLIATHHYFDLTGSETFVYTLAKALVMKGCKTTIYSPYVGGVIADKTRELGIEVFDDLKNLDNKNYDVAHVSHNLIAYEIRSWFPDIPIVFLSHGVLPSLEQPPVDDVNITTFLAVSEEVRDNLVSSGVPEDKILIFRNIIDTDRFSPTRPIKIKPERALIMSRNIDEQTMLVIKEACKFLNIDLAHLGKEKIVLEVENFLNDVDIVFSLGRGILEAMSAGRVSIVLDYNGGDGLVTPENIDEIQKCNFSGRRFNKHFSVEELISEIGNYNQELGGLSREIVLQRFSAKNNVVSLLKIYSEAQRSFQSDGINMRRLWHFANSILETRQYAAETSKKYFQKAIKQRESKISHLESVDREKEIQIRNLENTVYERDAQISGFDTVIKEKDIHISSLEDVLSKRDIQISNLEAGIRDKEGKITELDRSLVKKKKEIKKLKNTKQQIDTQISNLEELMRKKETDIDGLKASLEENRGEIGSLKEIVSQKDTQVLNLDCMIREKETALNHIYNSHGWKFLLMYYKIRDKILPSNTKRRLFLTIIFNALGKPKGLLKNLTKNNLKKFICCLKTSDTTILAEKVRRKISNDTETRGREESRQYQITTVNNYEKDKENKVRHNLNLEEYYNYLFETNSQKSKEFIAPSCPYIPETDIKLIAFYLPQFHPIPENDEWWGKGFTEWSNVMRAIPQFIGHYQPRLPGELGFYDLRVPEVQKRQIELAKGYGIYGFCFHFYWFNGKRLLEAPLKSLLSNPDLDFPFCLNWANENWTRRWDGLDNEMLMAQNHSPEDDVNFIKYISKYLRDKKYIRVGSKPLLVVYRPSLLPDPRKTAERWREWCLGNGIGEIYLATTHAFEHVDPREIGFDAAIEFAPNTFPLKDISNEVRVVNPSFKGKIFDYRSVLDLSRNYKKPPYKKFRGICPSWDNEARNPEAGVVLANSCPEKYKQWLENICLFTDENFRSEERLIFLNAWNEWAEAAYLEPDRRYGYAYLQSTAEALTEYKRNEVQKKILCVSHDAHLHGAQLLALNIVKVLKLKFNYEVHLILKSGGILESEFAEYSTVYDLEKNYKTLEEKIGLVDRLYKSGIKEAICNTVVSGDMAEIFQKKGIKTITLVHELPGIIKEYNMEKNATTLAENSYKVVFPSAYVKDKFCDIAKLDEEKTVILPQGLFNLNKYKNHIDKARNHLRSKLAIDEKAKIILGVGYGDYRKGVDIFVEVAAIFAKEKKKENVYFLWIGNLSPDMEELISHRIKSINNIIFQPTQEDISLFYAGTDMYLMTSREDPFPSVVLDAMNVGLPVIGFNEAGGFVDIVDSTGVLVPYMNTEEMARAAMKLLDDSEKREIIGDKCSKLIENNFNFCDYVFKLLRLLDHEYKKVSVIVPNYNYKKYLGSRLGSILNQTYPIFEIIFIDDASDDESLEVAKAYLREDLNMKIIRNEIHSGSAFKQWLQGLQMVKGDYVWIAEADDLCEENFLKELMSCFDKDKNVVLTYCQSKQIDEDGKVLAENYFNYTEDIDDRKWGKNYIRSGVGEISDTLVIKNTIPNVSAVVFKQIDVSPIADDIRKYKVAGDWLFYVWILSNGKIAYTNKSLNSHRRHNRSVIQKEDKRLHFDEVVMMQEHIMKNFKVPKQSRDKAESYRRYLKEYFELGSARKTSKTNVYQGQTSS